MWLTDASNDCAVADSTTGSSKRVAEDGEEYNRSNDTLESEEILNLNDREKTAGKVFRSYLCVWDAQEWQLQEEVQQESNHSTGLDTFVIGDVVGDVCKAWPDGCEQNFHALSSGCGLNTECFSHGRTD